MHFLEDQSHRVARCGVADYPVAVGIRSRVWLSYVVAETGWSSLGHILLGRSLVWEASPYLVS